MTRSDETNSRLPVLLIKNSRRNEVLPHIYKWKSSLLWLLVFGVIYKVMY